VAEDVNDVSGVFSAGRKLFRVQTVEEREKGLPMPPLPEPVEGAVDMTPNFARETVCLVGNGPSSPQHGDWIDKCDAVVRIQGFPRGEAGNKWDVWAGAFGQAAIDNIVEFGTDREPYPRVIWAVGQNTIKADRRGLTEGRLVYRLADQHRERVSKYCPNPTSGMLALEATLRSGPADLVIVGFDAFGVKDRSSWKHWDTKQGFWGWWPEKAEPQIAHHLGLEKELIMHWLRTREFCGAHFPETRPRWWRMNGVKQPGVLAGKKVCIVGNGPSAVQNAERIDKEFDLVVRINAFCVGEAGHKWDIYYSAFQGIGGEHAKKSGLYDHPSRPRWVWMHRSVGAKMIPFPVDRVDYVEPPRSRQICYAFDKWSKVPKGRHPVTNKVRPIQPTSGMFVLDMALAMQPAELTLVGFDATEQHKPGWKHYGSNPAPWYPERQSASGGKHDYVLEKKLIQEWVDTRCFFKTPYPHTKPNWIRLK